MQFNSKQILSTQLQTIGKDLVDWSELNKPDWLWVSVVCQMMGNDW